MAYRADCDCPSCKAFSQTVWDECIDRAVSALGTTLDDILSEEEIDELVLNVAHQMMIVAGLYDDDEPHTDSEAYKQELDDFDQSLTAEMRRCSVGYVFENNVLAFKKKRV